LIIVLSIAGIAATAGFVFHLLKRKERKQNLINDYGKK